MGSGTCGNVIAALASFFIPGLGQLLQGRWLLAAFMFVMTALLWLILLGWIIHLWSIIDAACTRSPKFTIMTFTGVTPTETVTTTGPTDMSLQKRNWALLSIAAGLLAAILSPALELATGRPEPYLFVLTALIILAWLATPLNRRSLGFTSGTIRLHVVAAIYPFVILGGVAAIAMLAGNASLQDFSAAEAGKKMLIMTAATWVGVLITEEGFFRGALWGMSEKAGWSTFAVLAWTSVAFMLWHFAVRLSKKISPSRLSRSPFTWSTPPCSVSPGVRSG